jgi:hypothetical protein
MIPTTIDLLTISNGEIQRKCLAKAELDRQVDNYIINPYDHINEASIEDYLTKRQLQFNLVSLVETYLDGLEYVKQVLRKCSKKHQHHDDSCQALGAVSFAYVLPEAYIKNFNDDNCGTYNQGVFVNINHHYSKNSLLSTVVHEFTHYLHHLLYPDNYNSCGKVLREMVAISLEEELDPDHPYTTDPHAEAKNLLQQLRRIPEYSQLSKEERFVFLAEFPSAYPIRRYIRKNKAA